MLHARVRVKRVILVAFLHSVVCLALVFRHPPIPPFLAPRQELGRRTSVDRIPLPLSGLTCGCARDHNSCA